ncbi:carboxy terminal-processing peptidase [Pseudomarimonas arenosa]|uniref:Carboxy terminal-processing peptidase n=1 Tax=Pseudomarimonas arenosa TaxID=2774145 RepID=A0AAW3ZMF2_9GAMM|nr:carboxy terminal-processing peptidase [Pseudomarimonas arenosa]MBD8525486.1 carboxy terminal-processing peptidase [Pseudomarimonas arenosa]
MQSNRSVRAGVVALSVFGLALAQAVLAKPEPISQLGLQPEARQSFAAGWVREFLSNSRFHYSPRALDDELSKEIYDAYLESLDGDRLFFLASDIERFRPWRLQLDDALLRGDLQPAFDIFNLYRKRVAERTDYVSARLNKPFEFESDDSYVFKREDLPWEQTSDALDKVWEKRVKNDYLRLKLAGKEDKAIVETLSKRYDTYSKRVAELKAEDVFQTFLNAYANSIEPHTAYMNARTSENFNISMRLSLEGIGAVLQRDDEYTIVRSIVPGGPADLSGKLKVGDRIVGVGQGEQGAVTDVVGWRIDDVVELIRGPKDSSVRLDVIPATAGLDGEHQMVTLVRQKVKLEEQAAKKRVIELTEGDQTRRIGVIDLPTFYQDFEGRRRDEADYRSASRDVAKLLAELKKEKIDGLVIDLRNNGGGSLTEAIELTGLFIDKGPVVQVRDYTKRVSVEKDDVPGVAWEGPMAVLVNRASASASEIFAGAIQDYGRGLIIGEPTFGKGTVQNLVDLDRFASKESPGLGQIRLTVAQFFRVSGGSTQHKGVVPDIAFPVTLDAEDYGESAYDNALPWTEIDRASHQSLADFAPLIPALQKLHESRAGEDLEFRWWSEDVAEYRRQREQQEISLNFAKRQAEREAKESKRKAREEARKAAGLGTDGLAGLDDGLQADERGVEADEEGAGEQPQERPDPLLREAAQVLVDAIGLLRDDRALAAQVYPSAAKAN